MIAVIEPNDVKYDQCAITNFTQDKINDLINNCTEFKKGDLIQTILRELDVENNNLPIHTAVVSHISDELYQISHLVLDETTYGRIKGGYNGVATYLTDTNVKVFGPAVLYKVSTF